MSNITRLRGLCPAPFFDESMFPVNEGYLLGRFCAPIPGTADQTSCCLPCPATDWVYPESFHVATRVGSYLSLASVMACLFIIIAFIILPAEYTRRQYLNVCLTISIILVELGPAVAVFKQPQQCINEITPQDMYGSMECAWTGALIVSGGCSISIWILARALSMHLQICWNIVPGKKFFYSAQVLSWGITGIVTAICLYITGVSFRFGNYCQVNRYKAVETLWGPLLGFSGMTLILQVATFIYCLNVYLKNLANNMPDTVSSGPSSSAGSQRTQTARAVYRRVKKVLSLQWRSLIMSILVLVDVIYLAVVFLALDAKTADSLTNFHKMIPWATCLMTSPKEKCLHYVEPLVAKESMLIATMVILGIVGFQLVFLIGHWKMITGWREAFSRRVRSDDYSRFDVVDLRQRPDEKRPFEIIHITSSPGTTSPISQKGILKSPQSSYPSPLARYGDGGDDYFGKDIERAYNPPRLSFSSPRAPLSRQPTVAHWDPNARLEKTASGSVRYQLSRGDFARTP